MPVFLIERNFAEQLAVTPEEAAVINEINDDENVRWLISFLSVDKNNTFCFCEAPNSEAIRTAAVRSGIPADSIVEVGDAVLPSGQLDRLTAARFGEA